jgi:endonuclease/exonuclease/phosphatase family metal-dependent hydrolase
MRGPFLHRPAVGPVEVVASGRGAWVGWVELITETVNELATQHTAQAIKEINADVMGVVEAESRPTLKMFSDAMLLHVDGVPYEQVMLVDGNDDRGIDVGLLAREDYALEFIATHIFDTDAKGVIFSRDCCEYHLATKSGDRLVVLVNHFKSKGFGSPAQSTERRKRQATRVAEIYQELLELGETFIAVVGDFNDNPTSAALAPLLAGTDLTDISAHPGFDRNHRDGTYGGGGISEKIDYILLSPDLYAKAAGGGVYRKGVWHGNRTKDPWDIFATMTAPAHQASDHAAIYADLDL